MSTDFVEDVRTSDDQVSETAPPAELRLSVPDKPSIAVLPFANLNSDQEHDAFVDGVTEEIITALSRVRWFFVIARGSTFAYRSRETDVKEIAQELGVRYVLVGSIRHAGDRIR